MRLEAMILVFWMLSFKPDFSLSSFTFIRRLSTALITRILNPNSLPLATRDQSSLNHNALFSLVPTERTSTSVKFPWDILQKKKLINPGGAQSSIISFLFFTKNLQCQDGAASHSVGISLHYKWDWLNLYFRGREFSGFSDIFFLKKTLRHEKKVWKNLLL